MKIELLTPKLIINKPTYVYYPKWLDNKKVYSYELLVIEDNEIAILFKEMLKIYKHETNLYANDISWIMAKLYDQILRYTGEEPQEEFLRMVGIMIATLNWALDIIKLPNTEIICYI